MTNNKVDGILRVIIKPINNSFEPQFGSVIYTDLLFGLGNHSGIYVGNRKVVSLLGDGFITQTGLERFTGGSTTIMGDIYIPYDTLGIQIGSLDVGNRALVMIGENRSYDLLLDNCHQFCSGCLTGEFDNHANFLWMLKEEVNSFYNTKIVWKEWDWRS